MLRKLRKEGNHAINDRTFTNGHGIRIAVILNVQHAHRNTLRRVSRDRLMILKRMGSHLLPVHMLIGKADTGIGELNHPRRIGISYGMNRRNVYVIITDSTSHVQRARNRILLTGDAGIGNLRNTFDTRCDASLRGIGRKLSRNPLFSTTRIGTVRVIPG